MNKEIIDAYIETWNDGNYDRLTEFVSENVIRNVPETANQSTDNLNGLIEVMNGFRTAFPDCKVTAEEIHFTENHSFQKFTFTGTNTGPGDFSPTGNTVSVSGFATIRYENGKMAQEDVYYDVLGFMAQLGIIKLPGEEEAAASA
jgi:steroid delta-isomerase-like uncharacterized protein